MENKLRDKIIILILSLILLSGYWYPWLGLDGVQTCLISKVIGFDCLGCGLTRSFMAMGRLRFLKAFEFHWAGPLIYILFFILLFQKIFSHFNYSRINQVLYKFITPLIVVLLILNWLKNYMK